MIRIVINKNSMIKDSNDNFELNYQDCKQYFDDWWFYKKYGDSFNISYANDEV